MGKALRIPTRNEVRDVARLAAPIVVVQVGLMLMGVVDAAIVGRYSAQGLAAVALGNVYFNSIVTIGHGTLMALDPLIAQAVGARTSRRSSDRCSGDSCCALCCRSRCRCSSCPANGSWRHSGSRMTWCRSPRRYARACIPGRVAVPRLHCAAPDGPGLLAGAAGGRRGGRREHRQRVARLGAWCSGSSGFPPWGRWVRGGPRPSAAG